jgi:hypothetical protein
MYKILLLVFLIPLAITATEKEGKYTKNKVLNKEFTVNADATLNLTNKYGSINIATWEENRIVIKVSITTNGNDEDKVKTRLEQIDVEFSGNSNNVSAKTLIEKSSRSWSIWGKSNNVSMEINYLIKMPITNNLDVNMDYGSITLDKLEGTSKIDCDYGSLHIGELLNTKNYINIDYTNKSTIDFMKDGEINADYSTLTIDRSGRTTINADYSHLSFGLLVDLDYNCDYGSLTINEVGNITGNSDYMHTKIETLRGSGTFDSDYGSIKIGNLVNHFKNLTIESSYATVKIGIENVTAFDFSANLNYTGFKKLDGFNFTKEIVKNSSKQYEGYFGESGSNKNITIKSSYGSVTFNN